MRQRSTATSSGQAKGSCLERLDDLRGFGTGGAGLPFDPLVLAVVVGSGGGAADPSVFETCPGGKSA